MMIVQACARVFSRKWDIISASARALKQNRVVTDAYLTAYQNAVNNGM
jgi:hypothetical protein